MLIGYGSGVNVKAIDVAVNEENFPDSRFRSFVTANADTNKDDFLSADEIEQVEQITLTSANGSIKANWNEQKDHTDGYVIQYKESYFSTWIYNL